MRRALIILTMLLVPKVMNAPVDVFTERVLRFELSWDKFVRQMYGCPQGVVLVSPWIECRPATGKIDYAMFKKTCQLAADMYGFDKQVCRAE